MSTASAFLRWITSRVNNGFSAQLLQESMDSFLVPDPGGAQERFNLDWGWAECIERELLEDLCRVSVKEMWPWLLLHDNMHGRWVSNRGSIACGHPTPLELLLQVAFVLVLCLHCSNGSLSLLFFSFFFPPILCHCPFLVLLLYYFFFLFFFLSLSFNFILFFLSVVHFAHVAWWTDKLGFSFGEF